MEYSNNENGAGAPIGNVVPDSNTREVNEQLAEVRLEFGSGRDEAAFCREGWSTPEPDERWTSGSVSRVEISRLPPRGDYFLVLRLRAFISPGRLDRQRLGVIVNGKKAADFVVHGKERAIRACRLPWKMLAGEAGAAAGAKGIEIVFVTPDAASPSTIEGGNDDRRLAFAFTSILLQPDALEDDRRPGAQLDGGPANEARAAATQIPPRELMFKFESLGRNCEFGLVQRRCLAEPLGLLRFASTPLPALLAALEANFEGLGSPGSIEVEVSATGTEYMVADRIFGVLYHAWVKVGEIPPENILQREAKRVPILVRKLVEDLHETQKIFVFKELGATSEEEVMPLVAAIRRYGRNTLLLVTLADSTHSAGSIERRGPGLMVGYLERFAPSENAYDLALEAWVRLCREAYKLTLEAGAEHSSR